MDKIPETSSRIDAHRITKPIQLLAAWLVGLTAVNVCFLSAATLLREHEWIQAVLVIASVINVPVFLIALFLLQTKFRPEMQEDTYYSRYLESQLTNKEQSGSLELSSLRAEVFESNTRTLVSVESLQDQVATLVTTLEQMNAANTQKENNGLKQIDAQIGHTRALLEEARKEASWAKYSISVNDLLPTYEQIVSRFKSKGISISDTFGSSSLLKRKPGIFVLSFGNEVSIEDMQELIQSLYDLGLDAISYSDDLKENTSIYIGSYGYYSSSVVWLNEDLRKSILRPDISPEGFIGELRRASEPVLVNQEEAFKNLNDLEAKVARLEIGLDSSTPISPRQIAEKLDIPYSQVISLLKSALKKLDQQVVRKRVSA
jgi:hypothetical protein